MKTTDFENANFYKTIFLSAAHLSDEMRAVLLAMADSLNCYYCHRTTGNEDAGIILRFKAIAGDEWEDVEAELLERGLDGEFVGLIEHLAIEDIDAVHFDIDFDLLAGAHWYLGSGSKAVPLGYELAIVGYDDLPFDLQQEARQAYYDPSNEHGFTASEFFNDEGDFNFVVIDGLLYCLSDCMRLDDSSELKEYGFTGVFSESNTSAIAVTLSGDSDSLDAVRIF